MAKYTLYLDESETFTNTHDRFFAVGGVIIEESLNDSLESEINLLKAKLCGPLHSYQQCMIVSVTPHLCQHLVFSTF